MRNMVSGILARRAESGESRAKKRVFKKELAPAPGFEPGTKWLTATYSTIELCRSVSYKIQWGFRKIKYGNENICFFAVPHIKPQTLVLFAHTRCERVARERAGGERGRLFAGQKASRVPPGIAAASEAVAATMRRGLNAGRAKFKVTSANTYIFPCGSGKGVREKLRLSQMARVARPGGGAGLGAAKP